MPNLSCLTVALITGALISAGGGSGEQAAGEGRASATGISGRGIVTDVLPAGLREPAANLTHLLSESAPGLRSVRISCPEIDNPPDYPFSCELMANRGKGSVGGSVSVYGVYAPTMTYVYETSYGPLGTR